MHTIASFARRLSAVVLVVALTVAVALPVSAAGFGSTSRDGAAWFGASFVQWAQSLVATWIGPSESGEGDLSNIQAQGKSKLTPDGNDVTATGGLPSEGEAPGTATGN